MNPRETIRKTDGVNQPGRTTAQLIEDWKRTRLTADEKIQFEQAGYLIIPSALTPDQIESLVQGITRYNDGDSSAWANHADIMGADPTFLELSDLDTVAPKVLGIMGANIWINHSHLNVNPPEQASDEATFRYAWHRDGGAIHQDIAGPIPLMSIKVGLYLTDLRLKSGGQTFVIPGSHHADAYPAMLDAFATPPTEAIPLEVSAGSAVLFHQRLVHSNHSPNLSTTTRRAIFVQWGYRWLQPGDAAVSSHGKNIPEPVRRQMLGLSAVACHPRLSSNRYGSRNRSGRYYPSVAELPLRDVYAALYGTPRESVYESPDSPQP